MTFDPSQTIRIVRNFSISPERVFDAWLDPERAGKWLFATPAGQMVRVEIDARVGGSFIFTDRRENQDIEHVGSYLEIDRPRRLVFQFAVPKFSRQMTRVSIDIMPTPTGCELTLTHEGVLPEFIDRAKGGWGKILGALASVVDPNADFGVVVEPGTVRFERLLPGPVERVWAYLTESEKRGKWFAAGETEPRVGGSIELRFDPDDDEPGPIYHQRVSRYEPPRLLSWTWDGGVDGPSEVTFELTPRGDHVLLALTHRRLADRFMADVAGGWHAHLAALIQQMSGSKTRPAESIFSEADFDYANRLGVG